MVIIQSYVTQCLATEGQPACSEPATGFPRGSLLETPEIQASQQTFLHLVFVCLAYFLLIGSSVSQSIN